MGWSSHGSRGDTGLKPCDYLGLGMCWPVRILQIKTEGKGNLKAEGRRLKEGGKTGGQAKGNRCSRPKPGS